MKSASKSLPIVTAKSLGTSYLVENLEKTNELLLSNGTILLGIVQQHEP